MNYDSWFSTDKYVAGPVKNPYSIRAQGAGPNLIFENVKRAVLRVPNAYTLCNLEAFRPHVEIDFDMSVVQLDNEHTLFEVMLRSQVGAKKLSLMLADPSLIGVVPVIIFEADVTVSGVFQFSATPPYQTDHYLQHECPAMLFPRARKAIATLTRNMGYPEIWIERSQFAKIHERKIQKAKPNVPGMGNA